MGKRTETNVPLIGDNSVLSARIGVSTNPPDKGKNGSDITKISHKLSIKRVVECFFRFLKDQKENPLRV